MASVTKPTINRIIRMKQFDLLGTKITQYNMYMCLDTLQLWYDETPSKRILYNYTSAKTVNDILYNITPEYGKTYYCWEDNSLWLWMNKWITLWSDHTYPSAFQYTDGVISPVYRHDEPSAPADDNGLLHDGSVIVRDRQRIIKGKIYVGEDNDNLIISSFLGGGLRLLPNGLMNTDGELYIDDMAIAHIRAQWNVLNNEAYVDYSEHPEQDPNQFQNDRHRYKIYHEGNFRLPELKLDSKTIYDLLAKPDTTLPDPFEFNVDKLDGKHASDFALKSHNHTTNQITDFAEKSKANALSVLIDNLTNSLKKGIAISYSTANKQFTFDVDDFILTFTGGATGQGTVKDLTNTTIALTIDPSKHVHQNYIDRMDDLQDEIDNLSTIDPNDYYNKQQVKDLIIQEGATKTPTPGKALQVDANGNLPANASTASDLDHDTTLNLKGDAAGSVVFGYDKQSLDLNVSLAGIISDTPEAGKALKLDNNLDLQANAVTASALNHNIHVVLEGDVVGENYLDTSLNEFKIQTELIIPDEIITTDDLGILLPELNDAGIIDDDYLPTGLSNALKLVGNWESTTAPTTSPKNGQAWIVTKKTSFGGIEYYPGDWIYYFNNSWRKASVASNVKSVNGKTGNEITISATDVGGIPDTYINYSLGSTIPAGKIVRTDTDGHIAGATVDGLTNDFSLLSDSAGDVIFDSKSRNTSTDGQSDLDVKMTLTSNGMKKISDAYVRTILVNNIEQAFKKKLNIKGEGINVTTSDDELVISVDGLAYELLYFNGTASSTFLSKLNSKFNQKDTKPFYIAFVNNSAIHFIGVNDKVSVSATSINSDECTPVINTSASPKQLNIKTSKCTIGRSGDLINAFSISTTTYTLSDMGITDKYMLLNNQVVITVEGSKETYYPVMISLGSGASKHFAHLGISRTYQDTAPSDWGTDSAHKGGLTLNIRWTGDSSWGGNDHRVVVEEFHENYCHMVGGLQLTTEGLCVWLRGGTAIYRITSEYGTSTTATIYYESHTTSGSQVLAPKAYSTTDVENQVNALWIDRHGTYHGTADKAIQDRNGKDIAATYLPLTGGSMTGTISSSVTTTAHIDGNKGKAIINSTASGGAYTMLARMKSTNGVWTFGSWLDTFDLFYTTDATVSANTNGITHRLILLNEAGNTIFPRYSISNCFWW